MASAPKASLVYRVVPARQTGLAGVAPLWVAVGVFIAGGWPTLLAAEPAATVPSPAGASQRESEAPRPLPAVENARQLDPKSPVWVDEAAGEVIVDGVVSLRRGLLEMFACPRRTKEHESIVAVSSKAFLLHAGLLAVGAEPGSPVQWEPQHRPPAGPVVEITCEWYDDQGKKQTARAQEWIRKAGSGEVMTLPFVFAGSGFWTDPDTGEQFYMAEQGDLICVSNFRTAMLDVPADSSASNDGLLFEANTERIPPLGTLVRLRLRPILDKPSPQQPASTPAQPPAPETSKQ